MSIARQLFDVLVAGVLAFVILFLGSYVAPQLASTLAILVACGFYFSRYPWGSQDGTKINDRIDDLYDRYLPF
ncbi:hypothetical protein [Haloarchaeobius sp. HME9146]|uniref:hypothetical protein n=1 Tax=Haloarchaeobius sp. HME9146 TaxID=2978732 RepID=UPI0021BFE3DA|nr:hypothetical protein [Haloarchaeobius sp. HME9146]MCT9095346.1 hypothetical protein [Haloarchaeobius sp. HME9146]